MEQQSKKEQIAEMVASKSETIENGTIHVWENTEGKLSVTLNSWGYRDNEHKLLMSFDILNEQKPYTADMIMETIDFKYEYRKK